MGNEHTKQQLRDFFEKAIKKARNPDPREKMKRLRLERSKKIASKYGLT